MLPALIARYSLDALTGTVHIIGHLRVSDVRVPTPTLGVSLRGGGCVRAGAVAGATTHAWLQSDSLDCWRRQFGSSLFPPKPQWHPGVFEITAIDVGQGDSLLLITPEGKTLLMDSGGMPGNSRSDFDVGEEVVSPYLWSRGIRAARCGRHLARAHRPHGRHAQHHRELSAA